MWSAKRIRSFTDVIYNDQLIYRDNLELANTPYASIAEKVGHALVYGTLLLIGSRTSHLRSRLQILKQRQSYEEYASSSISSSHQQINFDLSDPMVAVSILHEEMMVIRFFANNLDDSYQLVAEMLQLPSSSRAEDHGILDARVFENRLHGGRTASDRASMRSSVIRSLRAYDEEQEKISR
jgi:urease accessory protein UreH